MNLLSQILQKWTAWVLPRPRLVLGVVVMSAIVSVLLAAWKLGIQTDQLELIATNHPLIALSDKLDPFNFGGKSAFTVAIEAPTPTRGIDFLTVLASRINADPLYFKSELHRVDPNLVKRWALLYLDKKDLLKIRDSIKENSPLIQGFAERPGLIGLLKLVNKQMSARMVGELFTGFLNDDKDPKAKDAPASEPMDLGFLIQTLEGLSGYLQGNLGYKSPWSSFFKDAAWNLDTEGYFWEGGKRYLLMFVTPEKEKDGFTRSHSCIDHLRDLIRETRVSFPDVQAGITGQEALNNDEMTTVLGDMAWATWISILGVLLLMVLFFRGLRRPLIEMVALVVGICWTFGWTTLFIGHLNILSVVFAPLLCGLGVDYGIHWFARYEEEERKCGFDSRTAIVRVTERSSPGILLAGLSGAFSFLPLMLTGFKGLMELGRITGMGILLILLADFTVLPALSILVSGNQKKGGADKEAAPETATLFRINPRTAHLVLGAAVVISCICAWSAGQVHFDLNPLRLQAKNAESVVWEKKLIEGSNRSLLAAAAFADSPKEVEAKTQAFEALPSVSEVESVFSYLPKNQDEKIPILRSILPEVPDIRPNVGPPINGAPSEALELRDVLERIRFKMQDDQASEWGAEKPLVEQMVKVRALVQEIVQILEKDPESSIGRLTEYRKHFRKDLKDTWDFLRDGVSATTMHLEDIPLLMRDWFYRDGTFLIRIYPKGSVWDQNVLARFVKQVQSVDSQVAGEPVSLYVFASAYKRACYLASIYAVIAVMVLLALTFRRLSLTMLALVPLAVGTIWTVGIMGFSGFQFNLANSIFMPLIVGAGVEYGVIILYRWKEGRMQPGQLPLSTGKGVILAALTTTVGFGTLMVSHHQGIFSLGFVAWVGSLCVLLAAVVLLPALLADAKTVEAVSEPESEKETTLI